MNKGNRKFIAYVIFIIGFYVIGAITLLKGFALTDTFWFMGGTVTAGFFGFNFGEHWAKNRSNGKELSS